MTPAARLTLALFVAAVAAWSALNVLATVI